jgi:hypothetical protein
LFGLGYTPDYVLYHELILTSKEYMRTVTAVEPQWLAELGPVFYSIRDMSETHADRLRMARQRQVDLMKQEDDDLIPHVEPTIIKTNAEVPVGKKIARHHRKSKFIKGI